MGARQLLEMGVGQLFEMGVGQLFEMGAGVILLDFLLYGFNLRHQTFVIC